MSHKYLFLLLVSSLFWRAAVCQQASSKPNVIFIICDDLNDYQGVFGGHPQAKTPHIDRLAAEGVRFVNAQSNVPVCSPSRNSLITGVYPHDSRDYGWTRLDKQPVLKNNKTIIRFFKENGYTTLGTGKIIHGGLIKDWDEWGMSLSHNYGPFYFDGEKRKALPSVPAPYSDIGPIDGSWGRLSEGGLSSGKKGEKGWVYGYDNKPLRYINEEDRDLLQDELHARWAVEKLQELEKREEKQPFFMGIGFVRPHTPLHAPDTYFDMFPLEELELEPWKKQDTKDTHWAENLDADLKGPRYYRTLLASYGGDRELALKHFLQAYLACVAFVDEQVGKVLDGLDNSRFKDNTIVVFTSDHGWNMGEKSYLFKNSPWEESTRIPMIIKTPHTQAGLQVAQPVSLIDLFPTLADLCHLTGDHKINAQGGDLGGQSMLPLLEGKAGAWQGPPGALSMIGNVGVDTPTANQHFSYRTQDWRYIRYGNGQEELYDHRKDPYEWKNLADRRKYEKNKTQLAREMQAIIQKPGKHLFILSGQSNMARLDEQSSFVPAVEAEFGKDHILVVKDAMGSQPISRWYKGWLSPTGDSAEQRGDLYDRLMDKVHDAIQGQQLASVTFIWMQGERDARMQWGEVYEKSLQGLYDQLSKDLKRTDVNFIIGRLNDFDMKNEKWPHWVKVRNAQIKIGESNPHFAWVNTDDLNDGFNAAGKAIENDLHMSVKGYEILGRRFAEKAIQLIRKHE